MPRVAQARVIPPRSTVVIVPSPYVDVEAVPPASFATQSVAAVTSLTLASTTNPRSGAVAAAGSFRSAAAIWSRSPVSATPTSPATHGLRSEVQLIPVFWSAWSSAWSIFESSEDWSLNPGKVAMMLPTFSRWSPGRSARASR